MELILRAYDHDAAIRAESMTVRQLWTLLESGGLRDRGKARPGLTEQADLYARETLVERLLALQQEGAGDESMARLRGGAAPDLSALRNRMATLPAEEDEALREDLARYLRRQRRPSIEREEAVALREDLVRYETYGLWQAPEAVVVRTLTLLTGQPDVNFLLGAEDATSGLQSVLEAAEDERVFAERFGVIIRNSLAGRLKRPGDADVQAELTRMGQLLAPLSRLLRDAREVGLRVIAYQEDPEGSGLARFLSQDMPSDPGPASIMVEDSEA